MRQHQISLSTSFKRIRHGSQKCVSCFYTNKQNKMNKKTIITILLALVAIMGQAQTKTATITGYSPALKDSTVAEWH